MPSGGDPRPPAVHDLFKDLLERAGERPVRIMAAHLPKIAVVTDVVADAVLIYVAEALRFSGGRLHHLKRFQNGAGVVFPAAQVVDFGDPRLIDELEDKA